MVFFNSAKRKEKGTIKASGKGTASAVLDFDPRTIRVRTVSKASDISSMSCNPGAEDEVDFSVERIGHRSHRILFVWNVVGQKEIHWFAQE